VANDKKKGLGKGLSALMGGRTPAEAIDAAPPVPAPPATLSDGSRLIEIDPTELKPNPKQPRHVFREEALQELADSIRRDGVQEPVIVRPAPGGGFELISGERRVRASIMADLTRIPAVVRDVPDDDLLRLGLIENLQREDLDPIETARAYQQLIDAFGLTQEKLAAEVGKERATVANSLRLLQLSQPLQDLVAEGVLTMGHARALLGLVSPEAQLSLARRIQREGLSVRQTEQFVAAARAPKQSPAPKTPTPASANASAIADELRRRLGTKVSVRSGEGGKGAIEINYSSLDELDRILNLLRSARG